MRVFLYGLQEFKMCRIDKQKKKKKQFKVDWTIVENFCAVWMYENLAAEKIL